MIETSKYAVKLAVIQHPEAFGLKDEEVNPLLAYTLIMAEAHEDIIDHESILFDFVVECEKTVDSKVALILTGRAKMPDLNGGKQPEYDMGEDKLSKPGNGKATKPYAKKERNDDGKLSVKQLRYIGYLKHQMGLKPDYGEIENLSPKAATMLIKDLEKEVSQR
jgi:hypothetical protein